MQGYEKQSLPSKSAWETRQSARGDGTGKQRMRMYGVETLYENNRFEVFRIGRNIFFLKLKGRLEPACPGVTRITRKEAEVLLYEHIRKEIKEGTKVCGMTEEEAAGLMEAKIREITEMAGEKGRVVSGENASGG